MHKNNFEMLYYTVYVLCLPFVAFGDIKKEKTKTQGEWASTVQSRFLEDLDDKEWHISHLRDADFIAGEECEESFDEKAKKYRETLRNDAALVEFVSGDMLPVNKEDLTKSKCKNKVLEPKTEIPLKTNKADVKEVENVATVSTGVGKDNKTNVRRSEYQFSSAEYYDEVQDFDPSNCPDTVEVITLELDQLRSYDLACEAIIDWRSLE